MKGSQIRNWLLISTIILLYTGCGLWTRRVKTGEPFALRQGESVVVAGTDLEIKLEGVGHQWYSNPQPKDARSSYVKLTITTGGAPPRALEVSDRVSVGDYTIVVNSADPFRSDDGPRCELVVTRQ